LQELNLNGSRQPSRPECPAGPGRSACVCGKKSAFRQGSRLTWLLLDKGLLQQGLVLPCCNSSIVASRLPGFAMFAQEMAVSRTKYASTYEIPLFPPSTLLSNDLPILLVTGGRGEPNCTRTQTGQEEEKSASARGASFQPSYSIRHHWRICASCWCYRPSTGALFVARAHLA